MATTTMPSNTSFPYFLMLALSFPFTILSSLLMIFISFAALTARGVRKEAAFDLYCQGGRVVVTANPPVVMVGTETEANPKTKRATGLAKKLSSSTKTPGAAATSAAQAPPTSREKTSPLSKSFVMLFIIFCLFATLTPTTVASACKRRRYPPAQKPQVVLVHGFSSGGFSWFRTRYILEMEGYKVTSIDLKACGLDRADISEVNTFEDYNEPLDRFMAQLPEREKVVLVGGSAGGVSVTKVLHDHPKKVLVAIYLSATMLKSGYLTCEDLEMGMPYFKKSGCRASCPRLPEPTCFEKSALGWKEIPLVYQTEDYTLGKSVARPGPLRAILTANFTEVAQSSMIDQIPRVYIQSMLDQVLLPAQQDAMINTWPPCEVVQINTGHGSPFTSPQLVAALVVNATLYSPAAI